MRLSPDDIIFWQYGFFKLNATIVLTWGLMFVLAVGSELITRKLSTGLRRSRWQNFLEIIVTVIEKQIEEVGLRHPEKYIGFLGTLFLFVAAASLGTVIPGWVFTAIGPESSMKHGMPVEEFARIVVPQLLARERFVVSHYSNVRRIKERMGPLMDSYERNAPRHAGDNAYDVRDVIAALMARQKD